LHNKDVTESVPLIKHNEIFYYSLSDVAVLFGLMEVPENRWRYVADHHEIILDPHENLVKFDNLVIPINNPVLEKDGLPYVSAEVFPLFGWRVELDTARQHVIFQQNWGWWL